MLVNFTMNSQPSQSITSATNQPTESLLVHSSSSRTTVSKPIEAKEGVVHQYYTEIIGTTFLKSVGVNISPLETRCNFSERDSLALAALQNQSRSSGTNSKVYQSHCTAGCCNLLSHPLNAAKHSFNLYLKDWARRYNICKERSNFMLNPETKAKFINELQATYHNVIAPVRTISHSNKSISLSSSSVTTPVVAPHVTPNNVIVPQQSINSNNNGLSVLNNNNTVVASIAVTGSTEYAGPMIIERKNKNKNGHYRKRRVVDEPAKSSSSSSKRGKNLSQRELNVLYEIMRKALPVGGDDWEGVARQYNTINSNSNSNSIQKTGVQLKRHYESVLQDAKIKRSGTTQRKKEFKTVLEINDMIMNHHLVDFQGSNPSLQQYYKTQIQKHRSDDCGDQEENKSDDHCSDIDGEDDGHDSDFIDMRMETMSPNPVQSRAVNSFNNDVENRNLQAGIVITTNNNNTNRNVQSASVHNMNNNRSINSRTQPQSSKVSHANTTNTTSLVSVRSAAAQPNQRKRALDGAITDYLAHEQSNSSNISMMMAQMMQQHLQSQQQMQQLMLQNQQMLMVLLGNNTNNNKKQKQDSENVDTNSMQE